MLVKNEQDIDRLAAFLKNRLSQGQSTEVAVRHINDGPTTKQIACLNSLIRDLTLQSIERGLGENIKPDTFKSIIYDMFIGEYAELLPDGKIRLCPPSAKHGITAWQMSQILEQIVYVFNNHYNYDICIKAPKAKLKHA